MHMDMKGPVDGESIVARVMVAFSKMTKHIYSQQNNREEIREKNILISLLI